VAEPVRLAIFGQFSRGYAMTPKEFQKSNLAVELKTGMKRLEDALHGLSDEQCERAWGYTVGFGSGSPFRDRDKGIFGVDGSL
jgi:hypothetical protein